MNKHPMADCRIEHSGGEILYHFFCGLSGALVCTVRQAAGPGQGEDQPRAWESAGRQYFNLCRRCGRWVCDTMYNPDTLQCVDCSPWEEQPAFCPQCGERVREGGMFCRKCRARLRYGEEVNAHEGPD